MIDPYRRTAKWYDKYVDPFSGVLRKIAFRMAPAAPGMRVLEVGCGTGSNLALYRQAGCKVAGIDLSPAMLKMAREKLGDQADLCLGDASDMPFAAASFDMAMAMLTLHEMPERLRTPVLQEMIRVLKPDGRLLLIDYHPGRLSFPKGWGSKAIVLFFEIVAGRDHFRNYRSFMTGGGLIPLIEVNDFRIDKKRILGYGNLAIFLLRHGENFG